MRNKLLRIGIVVMILGGLFVPGGAWAQADADYEIAFTVPVGTGVGEIGLIPAREDFLPVGPESLAVDAGGTIYLLDTVNARILGFTPAGELVTTIAVPKAGYLEALQVRDDHFYLLDGGKEQVLQLDHRGQPGAVYPLTAAVGGGYSGLNVDAAGDVWLQVDFEREYRLSMAGAAANAIQQEYSERYTTGAAGVQARFERHDPRRGTLRLASATRRVPAQIEVAVAHVLGGATLAGGDAQGNVYVEVQELLDLPVVVAEATVRKYDAQGALRGTARLPFERSYYRPQHPYALTPRGELYYLIVQEDEVQVGRVPFRREFASRLVQRGREVQERAAIARAAPSAPAGVSLAGITRDEIMQRAQSYVDLTWWCNYANYAGGGCAERRRPDYIDGYNQNFTSIPYKWGGFDDGSNFTRKLGEGKAAGDKNCTGGGRSCAAGLDCSGFASRAWNLPYKHSTRTLPNVSWQLSNAHTDLQHGDIMNYPGKHVVIFSYYTSNGISTLESTGAGWRSRAYARSWSNLSGYVPRHYNHLVAPTPPSPTPTSPPPTAPPPSPTTPPLISPICYVKVVGGRQIYCMNRDGTNERFVIDGDDPRISPNGQQLVFSQGGNIKKINVNGSNLVSLTAAGDTERNPAWSPDGTRIVYMRSVGGQYRLFVMNADGSEQTALPYESSRHDWNPDWSPDGQQIVFTSGPAAGNTDGVWIMNVDGTNRYHLCDYGWYPTWSPDGAELAFQWQNLRVMNADGSNPREVAGNRDQYSWPAWLSNEWLIYVVDNNIHKVKSDGSQNQRLTNDGTNEYRSLTVRGENSPRPTPTPTNTSIPTNTPLPPSPTSSPTNTCTPTPAPPSPPQHLQAFASLNSVLLIWEPSLSEGIEGYHVYRQAQGETTTSRRTVAPIRYLSWRDGEISASAVYTYYLTAIRQGLESIPSNPVTVTGGALSLHIPEVHAASSTTVTVPVNIVAAGGLCIGAMDVGLRYDADIATAVGVSRTALTAGYEFAYNIHRPDEVHITAGGDCHRINGSGTLFEIQFFVAAVTPPAESSLNFVRGLTGTVIYSNADFYNPIQLSLTDGQLIVDEQYIRGDLSGDGAITITDFELAMLIAIGVVTPTTEQLSAGDINGDRVINSADVTMVWYYLSHQAWPPVPAPPPASQLARGGLLAETVTVQPGAAVGYPGDAATVPLQISNAADVAGGTIMLRYGEDLQLLRVQQTTVISDFIVFTDTATVGNLTIGFVGSRELPAGAQTWFNLQFRVSEAATPEGAVADRTIVDVSGARLNDLAGRDFETVLERPVIGEQSMVQIELGEVGDPAGVPAFSGWGVVVLIGMIGIGLWLTRGFKQGSMPTM